jgi:membrane protein
MRKYLRKIFLYLKRKADQIEIRGYKNVTLYNVLQFYFKALQRGKIGIRSAGISFKFITALFPLIIFIFSLIPFIPIDNLQNDIMDGLKSFFPSQIFSFINGILEDLIIKKHTVLLSIGFILTIYFASNAVGALIDGLSSSHYIQKKHKFVTAQLWSLGLLFTFLLLFIFSFALTTAGQYLIDYLYDSGMIKASWSYWMLVFIKSTLATLIFMFSISILYNVANTEKTQWKFFNAGAITSTVLIIILKNTFGLYLTYFGKFDQIYGPIGAGLAFLILINYLFMLLIIGFELNVSLDKAYNKKNTNFEPHPKNKKA